MENSKTKQFLNFMWCTILRSVMKSSPFPLSPTCNVNHPFVQRIPPIKSLSIHLSYRIDSGGITLLWFKKVLFYLIMALMCKSRDVGNLDVPKKEAVKCFLSVKR